MVNNNEDIRTELYKKMLIVGDWDIENDEEYCIVMGQVLSVVQEQARKRLGIRYNPKAKRPSRYLTMAYIRFYLTHANNSKILNTNLEKLMEKEKTQLDNYRLVNAINALNKYETKYITFSDAERYVTIGYLDFCPITK